jgi:hypothetical protein
VLDKLYWALAAEEEVKVHFNGNLLVENKTGFLYFVTSSREKDAL